MEASHSGPVLSDNWTPADDEERTRRQGSHTTVRGKEWQFEGAHDEMLSSRECRYTGKARTEGRRVGRVPLPENEKNNVQRDPKQGHTKIGCALEVRCRQSVTEGKPRAVILNN